MRKSAFIFLPDRQFNSDFGKSILSICNDRSISYEIMNNFSRKKYNLKIELYNNLITWGAKKPNIWYWERANNILFIENGLLGQDVSMTCDVLGYYSESSVCSENTFEPSKSEEIKLKKEVKKRFGHDLFYGYDPNGPILIVLQRSHDAPVVYEFPYKLASEDSMITLLKICRDNLPPADIVVRSHPRDDKNETKQKLKSYIPSSWRWDDMNTEIWGWLGSGILGAKHIPFLSQFRAIVTINSTVATEALTLGVPVATLGKGAFTGSKATLECYDDPKLLAEIGNWEPDRRAITKYLCSVLRNEILYDADEAKTRGHHAVSEWLSNCLPKTEKKPDKYREKLRKLRDRLD